MLTINTQKLELGNIKYGAPHSFTFNMKNTSTSEIRITKLSVGCTSCTVASTQDSILSPNQEGVIDVIYTPGSTGITPKNISVNYTEGGSVMPAINLKFIANVYA